MTRTLRSVSLSLLIATAIGCGSGTGTGDVDATSDAPVPPGPPPQTPGQALRPGAGRLTGGAWSLDVELGGAVEQRRATGNGWTLRGTTPNHP